MKTLIVYRSKYGAARQYAQWLQETLRCDCLENKDLDPARLAGYDTIVLAGGVYAGRVAGLDLVIKNPGAFAGKRLAVLATGMTPHHAELLPTLRSGNMTGPLSEMPLFYGRGGWPKARMTLPDRLLCTMLEKSVVKKDPAACAPQELPLRETAGQKRDFDWTDRSALAPLIDWVNQA